MKPSKKSQRQEGDVVIGGLRMVPNDDGVLQARTPEVAKIEERLRQNLIATGLALSDDQRIVLKAACNDLRTDVENALFEVRGLLGGATALAFKAQQQQDVSEEIPYHVEHCINAAAARIEAIQCDIEDRFQRWLAPE